ncbi:hypothetical protein JYU12_02600 [bacterium AH-315-K03]|nr:hypothetical protein [bacterium AH-315-K03]
MSIAPTYHHVLTLFTLATLCSISTGLSAEIDLYVFPQVKIDHRDGESFSEKNAIPSINFFANGTLGPVLVLTEAFASEKAQHVERLQVGANVGESSRAWLGRHHNPFGYWHTQYHHGTYLQTSISRPAMAELGGAGGIVPSHTMGGLLEGEIEHKGSGWHYALSIGLTSILNLNGNGDHHGKSGNSAPLHDFDIFNPKAGDHKLGYTFKLSYLPDALGENQFGAFSSYANIALTRGDHVEMVNSEEINLSLIGVFANYQQDKFRLISEFYYFSSEVPDQNNAKKGHFSAAYIQTEYAFNETWTGYTRLEDTFNNAHDPYLALREGYVQQAQTVGVRVDITGNQAVKLEYANQTFNHNRRGQWLLSWSAVWP